MNSPLVFISSVINTTNQPLTYTTIRSVFTSEERFQQTLQTIASVRKQLPSARILLVESSFLTEIQTIALQNSCDYFLNIKDDIYAQEICLQSPKKGFGEAIQTYFAIDYIQRQAIQFTKFFKISGRYSLTEKFNPSLYSDEEFTFYKRACSNPLNISTVVYSVPYSLFSIFSSAIHSVIQIYNERDSAGFEEVFPVLCTPRLELNEIGVEGLVSVNGVYFTC